MADNTENLNEDYEELKEFLELQADVVQENCRIVTADMMGAQFALHVDKNVPPTFVPRMPRSAMPSENDTTARVTVACTVLGCYIGYFRGERDIQDGSIPKPGIKDPFLGGYTLSRIDFEHALLPNDKLVGDAHSSEELWLVAYNSQHVRFVPKPIGKMFVEELTFLPVSGHKPRVRLVMYVNHSEPQGIWLNKAIKMEPGSYRVTIHWPSIWQRDVHDSKHVLCEAIEQAEFDKHKGLVAAFLSRHVDALPSKPAFFSW